MFSLYTTNRPISNMPVHNSFSICPLPIFSAKNRCIPQLSIWSHMLQGHRTRSKPGFNPNLLTPKAMTLDSIPLERFVYKYLLK